METKSFLLNGYNNKPILVDARWMNNSSPQPVIFFLHGFKGFKDWGHFNLVADAFAQAGFLFVKFNFSHNGTTPKHPIDFVDLDAFGNNNYSIELDECGLVLNHFLETEEWKTKINRERVYLIGHSRGGGIAVLKAAEDERIKGLVTWAAVGDFINRNSKQSIESWERDGVVYTYNGRTKQQMPLYKQFYDDLQANQKRLAIPQAAQKLKIPYLIFHGANDEAVSVQDAQLLKKHTHHATLTIIDGANHTFGAVHPWNESALPYHSLAVVEQTIRFLNE